MKSEDIARLAGVSRSTVSRVINNYPNVPQVTKEKVMKIVEEYNYRPNTFARTLAGKKSNTIGLFFVITGGKREDSHIARNDYFASYLNYLVDVANGKEYYVLVNTISESSDYEKVNQAFLEKRIDGGVIIGTQTDSLTEIHLDNINAPLVVLDYDVATIESEGIRSDKIFIINSGDIEGIDKAVLHLKNKGHKNIGFIKGNKLTRSARVRFDGYKKAMIKHRLNIEERYIIEGEFSVEVAYKNIKKAIKEKCLPTAYISSNDYMAIEVIKALKEEGLSVPDDIAIIGFDNVHLSEQSEPALTTLGPRFFDMAKKAIEILDIELMHTNETASKMTEFEVDLIVRSSC